MTSIYKHENNGNVGVLTDCLKAESFMSELSRAVAQYVVDRPDDLEHDLSFLLPNAVAIILKLNGYKNEGVCEQRLLFVGDHMPISTETPIVTV